MKNKNLLITVLIIVTFSIISPAASPAIDQSIGKGAFIVEMVKTPEKINSASISFSKNILWDTTHGVYLQYEPSGRFQSLVSLLEEKGYSVTTIDNGILKHELSKYGIIVNSAMSAIESTYT
ncbi:MAG: hypothetical protein ACM3RX_09815, partial [Methanococcaceae archaeon]